MEFSDFRESFFYGERTDLSFKFLKNLDDIEAAEFLRSLLEAVGDAFDDGDAEPIVDLAYQWQVRGYSPAPDAKPAVAYRDAPFTAFVSPLADARVALLTSSGHFAVGADPHPFGEEDMSQDDAVARIAEFLSSTPELSAIPTGMSTDDLRVRHGGYDVRGARRDPNVVFPLRALHRLAAEGVIGEVAPTAFSFVGACSQAGLRHEALPGWIERVRDERADAVLLVPV